MAASLKTVAAHAGVSLRTAAYILNSDEGHRFRPATRAKVEASALALGYRANAAARTMRTGRFNAVALLTASGTVPNASILWTGLCDGLAGRDLHLTIARLSPDILAGQAPHPKALRQLLADAVVIDDDATTPPDHLAAAVEAQGIPCLWYNRQSVTNSLMPDDVLAAANATRRLIAAGHRRIGYFGPGEVGHISRAHRLAGYRQAMREAGLTAHVVENAPAEFGFWGRAQVECMTAELAKPGGPTAWVGYGWTCGQALLIAAYRRGLSLPRDLSYCGVGHQTDDYLGIDFSAEIFPHYDLGLAMAKLVLEVLDHPERRLPSRLMAPRVHAGTSIAPPRAP